MAGQALAPARVRERDRDGLEGKSWPGAQGLPDLLSGAAPRTLGALVLSEDEQEV